MIMVVGNKTDLGDKYREVPMHEAQAYALAQGFLFMETSAMDNANVELAFSVLLTVRLECIIFRHEPVSHTCLQDVYYVISSHKPAITVSSPQAPSTSLSELIRSRTSSLLPPQTLSALSPLPSPDLENDRPKSFDERLYEQARAIFGWSTGWTGSDAGSEVGSNADTRDLEERIKEEEGFRSSSPGGTQSPVLPPRRSSMLGVEALSPSFRPPQPPTPPQPPQPQPHASLPSPPPEEEDVLAPLPGTISAPLSRTITTHPSLLLSSSLHSNKLPRASTVPSTNHAHNAHQAEKHGKKITMKPFSTPGRIGDEITESMLERRMTTSLQRSKTTVGRLPSQYGRGRNL